MKLEFTQYNGEGFKVGLLPCDGKNVYWFFTWSSNGEKETIHDAMMVKELVLGKMKASKIPEQVIGIIEKSELSSVASTPLRFRSPLNLLSVNMCKGNTCVTRDAFHPMTPDLNQGSYWPGVWRKLSAEESMESNNWFLRPVSDRVLAGFMAERLLIAANFDCGKL
ncbi:monooxygenase 2-like [Zingiber officinale]|uniref:monooxygenase 2-like n=1 Tax=Zingiber officinale TaxID=94328 RepID=UPI001C4DB0A9|nr:monooxygenase 2-like [Zingiber officinale]